MSPDPHIQPEPEPGKLAHGEKCVEPVERWARALRVYRRLRDGLPQQTNSGPAQGSAVPRNVHTGHPNAQAPAGADRHAVSDTR